ncbi:MAG: transposase family protein [Cyanobacteria bacterium P01_D01_bin.6]
MEAYGHSKAEWLKSFLVLPQGIPSHDTISRLLAMLNPAELQSCFVR